MKTLIVWIGLLALTGCNTVTSMQAMRALPSERWVKLQIDVPWRDAYQGVLERMRICQAFTTANSTMAVNGDLREDLKTGTISQISYIGVFEPHYLQVIDVTPSPNGATIVAVTSHGPLDGYEERLRYWAKGGQECKLGRP